MTQSAFFRIITNDTAVRSAQQAHAASRSKAHVSSLLAPRTVSKTSAFTQAICDASTAAARADLKTAANR